MYLVESCHGLISRSDLQLVPVSLEISALFVRTLNCLHVSIPCAKPSHMAAHTIRLIDVVPCALSSESVIRLLRGYDLPLVELFLEDKLIRACEAFETRAAFDGGGGGVAGRDFGDTQHVVAVRADCELMSEPTHGTVDSGRSNLQISMAGSWRGMRQGCPDTTGSDGVGTFG